MVYKEAHPDELTLRDYLARDRTVLANERTLLSYLRTAFGFAAGGVTLVKLFPEDVILLGSGLALLVLGFLTAVFGLVRFRTIRNNMRAIMKPPADRP